MLEPKSTAISTPPVDFSTTETIRRRLEELKNLEHELADTPVILVVPIGGDASEFE